MSCPRWLYGRLTVFRERHGCQAVMTAAVRYPQQKINQGVFALPGHTAFKKEIRIPGQGRTTRSPEEYNKE